MVEIATPARIPLEQMEARHPGLTQAIAASNFEAARVCLDRHYASPVVFQADSSATTRELLAEWDRTDDRTRRAWANDIDTTEAGAYACTLAALEVCDDMVAMYRAETRTGADYYVAAAGSTPQDLEDCLRLEVSGVDRGDKNVVAERLKAKLDQAARGASDLPAMAGVVGFRAQTILFARLGTS